MGEILTIFLVWLVATALIYDSEVRAWNGGVCPDTGERWCCFDTDSQGGRGYRSGRHVVWISWPGVDR